MKKIGLAFRRCDACNDTFPDHSNGACNPNFQTNPSLLARSRATRKKWQAYFPKYDPTGAAQMARWSPGLCTCSSDPSNHWSCTYVRSARCFDFFDHYYGSTLVTTYDEP